MEISHAGIILNPKIKLAYYHRINYRNFLITRKFVDFIPQSSVYYELKPEVSYLRFFRPLSPLALTILFRRLVKFVVESLDQDAKVIEDSLLYSFHNHEIVDLVKGKITKLPTNEIAIEENVTELTAIRNHPQFRQMRFLVAQNAEFLNSIIKSVS